MDTLEFPSEESVLVRAIALRGFGGRRAGELAVFVKDGTHFGSLFGGIADEQIGISAKRLLGSLEPFDVATISIGDNDAVRAGLACGGEADVLLHRRSVLPGEFISALTTREPVALATVISGPHKGIVISQVDEQIIVANDEIHDGNFVTQITQLLKSELSKRRTSSSVLDIEGDSLAVEVFSLPTELVIVGESDLATAISQQGAILGWTSKIVDSLQDGVTIVDGIGANDALVVLSHDHDLGVPLMEKVLRDHPATYVGGLGSRHTQQVRRDLLKRKGTGESELERIHGPMGLDLGSRTPEETAMAICAEILAHLSRRTATSLKNTSGPING